MATLGKIRSKGVLMLIIIGGALLIFIVTDFINGSSSFFNQQKSYVGKIDGTKVAVQDYSDIQNQYRSFYEVEYGDRAVTDELTEKIQMDSWNQIITEQLIEKDAATIGMSVPESQITDMTVGDNTSPMLMQLRSFRNEQGAFDIELLKRFISQLQSAEFQQNRTEQVVRLQNFWQFIGNNLVLSSLLDKYNTLLSKALVVNSLEAKYAYENSKTSVDLVYAIKPYFMIDDANVNIPDEEVKKLYDKRKEQFKQSPAVDMAYVVFPIVPSKKDFTDVHTVINELKNEFFNAPKDSIVDVVNYNSDASYVDIFLTKNDITPDLQDFAINNGIGATFGPELIEETYKMAKIVDKIFAPDSVKLNIIVVLAENEDAVKQRVDSIFNAMKAGATFAQMAEQVSADKPSAAKGGEVGWFRQAALMQFDADVAKSAFVAPINVPFVISNDVNPQQANIFMVSEKTVPVVKVKLAVIEQAVTPSNATADSIWQQAKAFAASSNNADEMKANAQKNGYAYTPIKNLDYNTRRLGNLPATRPVIQWAIKNDTKLNSVSDVMECNENLIVATVTERNTSGYTSFETVKPALLAELKKNKKFELMKKDFDGKNINTLKAEGLSVDSVKNLTFNSQSAGALGNEPKLIALAPSAEVNKSSAPIEGNMGVIVFEVLQKSQSDAPYNEQQEKIKLSFMRQQNVFYLAFEALKKAADVKDERYRFF